MTFDHPQMLWLLVGAPLAAAAAWRLARAGAVGTGRAWMLGALLAIAVGSSALAAC